eukprot:TRINITY_DN54409_c0_g1_i2.p1 TRINITY_DN54409_c0_g1~~TRINITY_DN54409_c0_g1_i2.p1  ORF type:complete len:354 (+),score=62.71 TRINITY_DN54409_c0_g1_i2:106-1167(+)
MLRSLVGSEMCIRDRSLTIGYWNSSGGGLITEIHLVLEGPPRTELQRHVALQITYDDLPHPSVFVPVGDFFMDQAGSRSDPYESKYFAKRPRDSWHCLAPIPYRHSIRIQLVSQASEEVVGYTYVYHDSKKFAENTGYFHAIYRGNVGLRFPWEPAPILPAQGIKGPGHLVGTALAFTGELGTKFGGNFDHVCEGNYELFYDNITRLHGNDTTVDYRKAGYQTSDHVIAVLGSEDWYGYSYGWPGNEKNVGAASGLYGTRHSGTTYWDPPVTNGTRTLSTYRFFGAPLRFEVGAWGQVNWGYDTGHNVPSDLCPVGQGCRIAYSVMSYWYLATPRDVSGELDELPWKSPFEYI